MKLTKRYAFLVIGNVGNFHMAQETALRFLRILRGLLFPHIVPRFPTTSDYSVAYSTTLLLCISLYWVLKRQKSCARHRLRDKKMKKVIICFIVLFLTQLSFSQISLAVMEFRPGTGTDQNAVNGLADMLINSLYDSGNYDIVERSQINHALQELNLQGEYLSTADLTQIGQYLKVDNVLVGTVNFIPTGNSSDPGFVKGEYNLDVRIVNVKSSRVVATAGVTKSCDQTYRSLMPELASQLSNKLSASTLPCIQGYLYVYPEYLGKALYSGAKDKAKHLNSVNALGRSDWRLPTRDEIKMIADNLSLLNYTLDGNSCYVWSSESNPSAYSEYYVVNVKDKYTTSDLPKYEHWVILVATR